MQVDELLGQIEDDDVLQDEDECWSGWTCVRVQKQVFIV